MTSHSSYVPKNMATNHLYRCIHKYQSSCFQLNSRIGLPLGRRVADAWVILEPRTMLG
ncbi:MAG: hypothetical protein GPOALKHO_000925 [Sodalis sp.]|nr:MAG: hypothetical protein GPOALKHO_000925 [Sodalis sp.]